MTFDFFIKKHLKVNIEFAGLLEQIASYNKAKTVTYPG